MSEGENFNYYCDKVIHTMLAETVLLLPWARRRRRVKRLSMSVCMYVCMYICVCTKNRAVWCLSIGTYHTILLYGCVERFLLL